MNVQKFARKLKRLTQEEVLTGAISSLNKLLVDKGVTSEKELQKYFLEWLRYHEASKDVKCPNKKSALQVQLRTCCK